MNSQQAQAAISTALAMIAPECDLSTVDPMVPFRVELDLDSLDFLGLVESLQTATGVDIPESDYPRIETLAQLTDYLVAHSTVGAGSGSR